MPGLHPVGIWDEFVRSHFRYREESQEVVRTIPFMLECLEVNGYLEGDCDCISTFNAAALSALGLPVRLVAIRTEEENPEFTHVYAEGFARGDWWRLDPTVPLDVVDGEVEYARLVQGI